MSQAPSANLGTPEGRHDLVCRYGDALYRWAWVRTDGDAAQAEDVAQETFLAAFEKPERYDPARGDPWGWLVGLALNRLKTSRKGWRTLGFLEEAAQEEPHPMVAEEERKRIRIALTSLPLGMQKLLQAHVLEGKPLEGPSSTAWDRLKAAKEAFRKAARSMGVEA